MYNEYALVIAQIDELETKKEALRKEILAEMQNNKQEKVETELGKFSIMKIKQWTYPKYVSELEEEFKAQKAKSVSTGEATFEEK